MSVEDSGPGSVGEYDATVSFDVAADAYDLFMGRYSTLLASQMADLADVVAGERVLDVGCGPGALASELVRRVGADRVAAVDPSEPFVTAARARHPGVDVRQAPAEALPFPGETFDATLAQLVVHFMTDPVGGIGEMARVTRMGGVVAASVWDHAGGMGPVSRFWDAARELDPSVVDEGDLAGAREGHLVELFEQAGLHDVRPAVIVARLEHASFEAWWEPYTKGVGPAGSYVASLDLEARDRLRDLCRRRLPEGSFAIEARAWAARGLA
jgi:Methylase involved in ubiquinone/menaquinone biosynthesis